MQATYWYVYNYGGAPRVRHLSYNSAEAEAKRLCEATGAVYEVLEAKAIVSPAPKTVVQTLLPCITYTTDPDFEPPF